MDSCTYDSLVRSCSVRFAYPRGCWTHRNILESCTYLLHRAELWSGSKRKKNTGRQFHLAHTIDVCRYACSLYLFGTGTTRTLSAILGTYVVYSAHHNRHTVVLHCIRQVVRQTPAQGSYIRGQHKFRDILAAQPLHTYLHRTAWVALLGKVPCNACNSFTLRMASAQRSGEDNNENRKELGK